MLLPALVALAAAVAFGWSTAAMHADASRAPADVVGPLALVAHLVRQRTWLGGMAASLLGLGLHSLALRLGSIAVVQPLVVTSLVFTFLFRALLERRPPPKKVVGYAALTAAGLAVFLVAARSTTGRTTVDDRAALTVLAVGAVVVAACWTLSARVPLSRAGVLLGTSAGVVFGMVAGTLKAVTGEGGLVGAITTWPLYALACLGVAGFVLNQTAYRNVPLTSSVPVLNVVNPLVALGYGLVAFSERPAHGALALALEVLSLAVVLTGVFQLARQEAPSEAQQLAAAAR